MSPRQALPAIDADAVSAPFFSGAQEQRLLVQRCTDCGTVQLGNALCDQCFGEGLDWVPASGNAVIHSFVVMHVAYHPAFTAPYASAVVELEEGPRIPVLLTDTLAAEIGQPVVIEFAPTENAVLVPVARRR